MLLVDVHTLPETKGWQVFNGTVHQKIKSIKWLLCGTKKKIFWETSRLFCFYSESQCRQILFCYHKFQNTVFGVFYRQINAFSLQTCEILMFGQHLLALCCFTWETIGINMQLRSHNEIIYCGVILQYCWGLIFSWTDRIIVWYSITLFRQCEQVT